MDDAEWAEMRKLDAEIAMRLGLEVQWLPCADYGDEGYVVIEPDQVEQHLIDCKVRGVEPYRRRPCYVKPETDVDGSYGSWHIVPRYFGSVGDAFALLNSLRCGMVDFDMVVTPPAWYGGITIKDAGSGEGWWVEIHLRDEAYGNGWVQASRESLSHAIALAVANAFTRHEQLLKQAKDWEPVEREFQEIQRGSRDGCACTRSRGGGRSSERSGDKAQ